MAILSYNVTIQNWYNSYAKIDYSVSYDPVKNESTVTFNQVTHQYDGDAGYRTASYTDLTVKATDSGNTATTSCGTEGYTDGGWSYFYLTPSPKSVTVKHSQTAGKKQITISSYSNFWPVYINGNSHGADGSGAVTIEVGEYFPASTLTTVNGTLGVSQTLTVGRLIDSFTHTITYTCGTASGTICTKSSNTSIEWTPPLALASQNTKGTSVAVQLTITTYTGDTVLGTNTVPITCAIPETVKPSFTVAVSDAMGYANTFGGYVQTKSKLKVVVDVTTMYGASVTSVKIVANGETHNEANITTEALKNSGTNTITIEVIDSRGRKVSGNTTVAVLAYSAPAISLLTYERCDPDGTDNPLGDNAEITFSSAVTSLSGKNAISYTMEYKKTSEAEYATVNMVDFSGLYSVTNGTRIFAADAGSSYDVRLTVTDSFGSAVATLVMATGFAIMHWLPRGIGMAIGKIAELANTLELGWRIHMNGNKITGLGDPEAETDGANKRYVETYSDNAVASHKTSVDEAFAQVNSELANVNNSLGKKLSMKVLWENASPSSTFAQQSVSVNLSSYDFYAIVSRNHTTVDRDIYRKARVGKSISLEFNDSGSLLSRAVEYSSTALTFKDCKASLDGGSVAVNNTYIIPVAIYGIKGVS